MKRFIIVLCAVLCALTGAEVAQAKSVKVVSFNIVVSNHETENGWNIRKGAIANFLMEEQPDVVGLQEATYMQIQYLLAGMPDYSLYGVSRDTGTKGGRGEYSAIIYNRERYNLVASGEFWLSPTPERPSRSWNDEVQSRIEPHPGAMKHNRICTWVRLQDKSSKKEFFYFNTHLEFGYHADQNLGQTAREKGLALIVEKMQELVPEGMPVILSGDMNQMAANRCFAPLYDFGMKSARVEAKRVISEENRNSITWNGFNFGANKASTFEKEDKSKGPGNFFMIDYIYYKDCKAVEFRTIRDKRYGEEPEVEGTPYMSDHYPILSVMKM